MRFAELEIGKRFGFTEVGKRYVAVKINERQAYLFREDEFRFIHPNKQIDFENYIDRGELAEDKQGRTLLVSPLPGGRYGYNHIISIDRGVLQDYEIRLLAPQDGGEEEVFKTEVYIILSRLEKHLKNAQNLLESIKVMLDITA